MDDNLKVEVGRRVKDIREMKGLSRRTLSGKAFISEQFLRDVENGRRGLSLYTVRSLSLALNVTTDYIIFGATETDRRHDFASLTLASLSDEEAKIIPDLIEKVAEVYRSYEKAETGSDSTSDDQSDDND